MSRSAGDEPEPPRRLDIEQVMDRLRDPEVTKHLNQIGRVAVEIDALVIRLEEIDMAATLRRDGLEKTLYSIFLLADRAARLVQVAEQMGGTLYPRVE